MRIISIASAILSEILVQFFLEVILKKKRRYFFVNRAYTVVIMFLAVQT